MDQLSREDLLLYLAGAYLSAQEKAEIEQKLNQSPQPNPELEKLRQQIDQFLQENQRERELILDHLQDYLEGKITELNGIDFQQLLNEHPDCKRIYQMLQKELTLEEAAKLSYPVSEELAHRFDYLLTNDLAQSPEMEPSASLSETMGALIERIVLTLATRPEPALLGETTHGEAQIEITGNAVSIEVGAPGRVVKIFSQEGKELDSQTSDENSMVLFKDLEADVYKIRVEGYKIQEVRHASG